MFFPYIGVWFISFPEESFPEEIQLDLFPRFFHLIGDCLHEHPCQSEVIWQSSGT